MTLTVSCSDVERSTVRVLPVTVGVPVRVTPPEELPDSRTCIFERSTVVSEIDSLKVTVRLPVPVLYVAEPKVGETVSGGVPPISDISLSLVTAIGLSEVSETAPASMSSLGVVMALTVSCSDVERSTVRVLPVTVRVRVPTEIGCGVAPVRVTPA